MLIPSIALFIFASGIENGAGTGWTIKSRSLFVRENKIIKLFSMRGHLQIFLYVLRYSSLILITYVKILFARRLHAWVVNILFSIHQRLNKEYLNNNNTQNNPNYSNYNNNNNKNKNIFIIIWSGVKIGLNTPTLPEKIIKLEKNPLIARNFSTQTHKNEIYANTNRTVETITKQLKSKKSFNDWAMNNRKWFELWLVGITDGDGTFSIYCQEKKISLIFKITQSIYNIRVLYHIAKNLGFGSVNKSKSFAQFVIRDRKVLEEIILPIFDKYPLLTSKQFDYFKLRKALFILKSKDLSHEYKYENIIEIKQEKLNVNYISTAWKDIDVENTSFENIKNIMTKPWLVGFVEAEGSFYLVSKDNSRIVHGFGISQKLDPIVLKAIKRILHITTIVRYKQNYCYYLLDVTNSRSIENIIKYFHSTMKGMKSFEYRIWSRSYNKYKGNYIKLIKIRDIIRKTKKKFWIVKLF